MCDPVYVFVDENRMWIFSEQQCNGFVLGVLRVLPEHFQLPRVNTAQKMSVLLNAAGDSSTILDLGPWDAINEQTQTTGEHT